MRGIILINVHKNRKKCIDCCHAEFELNVSHYNVYTVIAIYENAVYLNRNMYVIDFCYINIERMS